MLLLLAWLLAGAAPASPAPASPGAAPAATPAAPPGSRIALLGALHIEPRGIFVVNTNYNRGTLYPGSMALLALPPGTSDPQYFISPQNTVVGFRLAGLSLGRAQISGAMDVNLRSTSPLLQANALAPQFYDVHIQLDTERFRAFVGQFPDVVVPFVPDTVNSFPTGYVPGALGYARPQLRADARLPLGTYAQVVVQGSLNRPIQTFDLADELVGRQAGLPDLQGRVMLAFWRGERPWERPVELGIAGHLGRRRVTITTDASDVILRTWSIAGDLRARAPTGTVVKARIWWGALLGDYTAGIFQTVNPETRQAIHARGMWLEVQQALSERWRVAAIYGRDDPRDADLQAGKQRLNQAAFLNVFWDASRTVGFGLEGSRWGTDYGARGSNRVWRLDLLFYLRF